MNDSNVRDDLTAKHERNQEQRLAEIKRWVEYIESTPAETRGSQFNRLVDAQIEAARGASVSAEQYERVKAAGREWVDEERR